MSTTKPSESMLDLSIPGTMVINRPPNGTEIPIMLSAPFDMEIKEIIAQAQISTSNVDVTLKVAGSAAGDSAFQNMDVNEASGVTTFTPSNPEPVSAGDSVTLLFENPNNDPLVAVQIVASPT